MPARLPGGIEVEQDGPLLRYLGPTWRGFVDYRDLDGLTGAGLDELIVRQVRVYAARDQRSSGRPTPTTRRPNSSDD